MSRMCAVLVVVAVLMGALAAGLEAGQKPDNDDGKWIPLFNGKNLDGWVASFSDGDGSIEGTWSVTEEGLLQSTGKPRGVIRTKAGYSDYVLEVEWRWTDGGGNGGVLLHAVEPPKPVEMESKFPRSLEVQLQSGNAGDFWQIKARGQFPQIGDDRDHGRNIKRREAVKEKPIGKWNHMTIRAEGDEVDVWVNGKKANHAEGLVDKDSGESLTGGAICLQSEGTPMQFRTIRLRRIE